MENIETEAAQFIVLYYTNLAYFPDELPKLYDQETAMVWRESLDSKMAVKFEDARSVLVPEIEKGSKVTVVNYSIIPNDFCYSVNVLGKIEFGESSRVFVQDFVIAHKYERIFIISDTLRLKLGDVEATDVAYREPRRKPKGKGGQQGERQQNEPRQSQRNSGGAKSRRSRK